MDKDIIIAIVYVIGGGLIGFILRNVTGENRASVRKTMTEAMSNDAGASSQYMEAAKAAAEMMRELQVKVQALEKHDGEKDDLIQKLTERVECLEQEKIEWQAERDQLMQKITLLTDKVKKGKGLAMK